MKCYLLYATWHSGFEVQASVKDAKEEFLRTARELDRFGQTVEASLHIAKSKDLINEYPDYVLSLGKFGGLRCERA